MAENLEIKSHLSTLATDPMRNFKFLVKITHQVGPGTSGSALKDIGFTLGFTSIAGLTINTDPIQYRQGGYNTAVQQIPGQTTFAPITLSRGVLLGTRQNWDWMRQLFTVKVGTGDGSSAKAARQFRGKVEISLLHHPITNGTGQVSPFKVTVHNAWPSSISYSDLNAADNALLVEQMTLVHEGFEVDWNTVPTNPGTTF